MKRGISDRTPLRNRFALRWLCLAGWFRVALSSEIDPVVGRMEI
ncbi:MAG: hypothetical protein WA865_01250 [Spirulinaceae cyanobacterium]